MKHAFGRWDCIYLYLIIFCVAFGARWHSGKPLHAPFRPIHIYTSHVRRSIRVLNYFYAAWGMGKTGDRGRFARISEPKVSGELENVPIAAGQGGPRKPRLRGPPQAPGRRGTSGRSTVEVQPDLAGPRREGIGEDCGRASCSPFERVRGARQAMGEGLGPPPERAGASYSRRERSAGGVIGDAGGCSGGCLEVHQGPRLEARWCLSAYRGGGAGQEVHGCRASGCSSGVQTVGRRRKLGQVRGRGSVGAHRSRAADFVVGLARRRRQGEI